MVDILLCLDSKSEDCGALATFGNIEQRESVRLRNTLAWRLVDTTVGEGVVGPRRGTNGSGAQEGSKARKSLLRGTKNGDREGRRRQVQAQRGGRHGTAKEAGDTAVKTVKAADKVQAKNKVALKEHIWELRCVLDGKKSSLRKTYKDQVEANDKVWLLNSQTRPWVCWLRVKNVLKPQTKTPVTLDNKFDIEFDELEVLTEEVAEVSRMADLAMAGLCRTRNAYRTLATSFDEAEADLNQGLNNIRQLVSFTAMATGVLSCGANDRAENEINYLEMALDILDRIQNEEEEESAFELVAVANR